jgi:hypothetical protein
MTNFLDIRIFVCFFIKDRRRIMSKKFVILIDEYAHLAHCVGSHYRIHENITTIFSVQSCHRLSQSTERFFDFFLNFPTDDSIANTSIHLRHRRERFTCPTIPPKRPKTILFKKLDRQHLSAKWFTAVCMACARFPTGIISYLHHIQNSLSAS